MGREICSLHLRSAACYRAWVSVYSELIEFCELMLTRPDQHLEVAHLRRRVAHYRRRLRC